jgi:hypothetical protein
VRSESPTHQYASATLVARTGADPFIKSKMNLRRLLAKGFYLHL